MASTAAKVKRKAHALNRLKTLSDSLAENLHIEVPDVRITNRDPELAEIQRIENINDLLAGVLKASGVEVEEPKQEQPAEEPSTEEASEPIDLEVMTKAELLETAESRGVGVSKSATKATIIEKLQAAE